MASEAMDGAAVLAEDVDMATDSAVLAPAASATATATAAAGEEKYAEEAVDCSKDHSSWAALQKDLEAAVKLEYIVGLKPCSVDVAGNAIGNGWLFEGTLEASEESPYDGAQFRFQVSVDAAFPASVPRFRFMSIIMHTQVTSLGYPRDYFVDAIAAPKGLLQVIEAAHTLLEDYVEQPLMSDEEAVRMWREHDAACTCDLLPMPYKDLVALADVDEAKAEAALVDLKQRHRRKVVPLERQQLERYMATRQYIKMHYKPKHPELFNSAGTWQDDWFAPSFLAAIREGSPAALDAILTEQVGRNVLAFDMFTPEFCDMLADEIKAFEASHFPKNRPNSMNRYGVILNDMGLEGMMDSLVANYIKPLAAHLFEDAGGKTLDHHHSFIVQYKQGEDLNLDMHIDDAEVTTNVNIFDDFTGAGLAFCGMRTAADRRKLALTYQHVKGRAVIHRGRQRHGALDLTSGERLNLIVWARSATFRQSPAYYDVETHPQEAAPDAVCMSRTHDEDYAAFQEAFAAAKGAAVTAAVTAGAGAGTAPTAPPA